jgi:hypothetical protein
MGSSMPSTKGAANERSRRLEPGLTPVRAFIVLAFGVAYACANASHVRQPSLLLQPNSQQSAGPLTPEPPEPTDSEAEEESFEWLTDAGAAASRVHEAPGKYRCTNSRPRVCEAMSSPVCARRSVEPPIDDAGTEQQAEYLNGCLACADPSVISYVLGRCAYRRAVPLPAPSAHDQQR